MPPSLKIQKRFRHEHDLFQTGLTRIAGIDEAGRGPLAGPVVAAAVIFPSEWFSRGIPRNLREVNDSKQLSPEDRERFFGLLTSHPAILHAVAEVDVDLIDRINILNATHRAMQVVAEALDPEHILVDGLRVKTLRHPQTPMVGGDGLSYSIAAASIIAKVTRDRIMLRFHEQYPHYRFNEHKGYGTPDHISAIRDHGPCPIHRMTFHPFRPRQIELL